MLIAFSLDDPSVQAALQTVVLAVVSLLGTLLAGLIGWAGASARKWLASKAHGEAFACATTKLEKLTQNAVQEVEQTLVRQLKADEKWDAGTAKEARDTAVEIVKKHLGEKGMVELKDCMGVAVDTVEGMIRTHVEKHVYSMNATSGAGKAPLVPLGK